MKKFVMATLLAVTAIASQAQVSVSGKVSMWAENLQTNGESSSTVVTTPTSNIRFSGTEKLGNGLSARAVLETSISGSTYGGDMTRLGDRQGTVGLVSQYGSIDLGRNTHSQFNVIANNDAFGALYGSIVGDVHNLRGLRKDQGVYVTLTPIKGITLTYDRSQGERSRMWPLFGEGTTSQAYSATGSLLGARVSVAQFKQGSEESTVVAANYKLGAAQLSYIHSDDKGFLNSKGDSVGVRYTLANSLTAKASYGRTNTDTTAYVVGLDHSLSKRTEVGVVYRDVNRVGDVSDVRQIGVGLTHRF